MKLFCVIFILGGLAASRLAASDAIAPALGDGETLTYKVAWAILPGAGEIKIAAHKEIGEEGPLLRAMTTTATRGFARMLMPFEARSESLYDARSGRLLSLGETNRNRGKSSEHTVEFDYVNGHALYRVPETPEPRLLVLPPGNPTDLITSLLQTRTWNLVPGEARDALVLFNDEFYELTIHAKNYEEVRTPMGTYQSLLLVPRMEKTAPKGVFRQGGTVRVWIAQDAHRLPVRFELEFKIGKGVATLTAHQPPLKNK